MIGTDIIIKIGAVLALLAALYFGERHIEGIGYDRAHAECVAATDAIKRDAAATLASETAKTRDTEQALQAITNRQEQQDATNQQTVNDLSDRLRRAAGPSGRLRDPYAAGCGAGSSSATASAATTASDSPADPAPSSGLLSVAATDFLLALARDADETSAAYASCRADAFAVRGAAQP